MAISSPNAATVKTPQGSAVTAIPPLENGDRLTRLEFERRYQAMPHVKKAELIEGIVYMPSPVRHKSHSSPHGNIVGWVFNYKVNTPGVELGDNGTVRLDDINEPQPDAMLFLPKALGGQSDIDDDDYVAGAPELVVEVAASTVSRDLGPKLTAYQRNRVQEYVVWRVADRQVDWFVLKDDRFEPLEPGEDGILRSQVFPGLWLDPAALVRGDLNAALKVLNQGLESDQHKAFVERLEQATAR